MEEITNYVRETLQEIVEQTHIQLTLTDFCKDFILMNLSVSSYIIQLPSDKLILKIPKPCALDPEGRVSLSEEVIALYSNEITILKQLGSIPGIVNVKSMGNVEASGLTVPYLLMQQYDGSIDDFVGKKGNKRLTLELIFKYAIQISDTLMLMHAQGLLYADLKPSNCLVDSTLNACVLADFQNSCCINNINDNTDPLGGTKYYAKKCRTFLEGFKTPHFSATFLAC